MTQLHSAAGVEIVGPKYRLITGIVIEVFFACGFLILVGVAYAIRCDTYLHLVLTLPIVCYSSYYWFLYVLTSSLRLPTSR